jgi:murein DD-endopeptidase MepM/ murein hydrolase activator NlpD
MRHLSLALAIFAISIIMACNKEVKPSNQLQAVELQSDPDTALVQQVEAEFDSFGFRIDTLEVNDFTVKRNESFYLILDKFNFSAQEIYDITQKARRVMDVRHLRPGQSYRIYASSDSGGTDIARLVWQPNPVDYVVFEWQDSLNIYASSKTITTTNEVASAIITSSLYEAMQKEGLSPLLAYKLSEIYAWEIDFYQLRDGDNFRILYEKKYIDGEEYGVGDVLAAEFEHRGETYTAYKFESDNVNGYFDRNGNSLQKALLKVPFKYNHRISSGFSHNRFHPVLKRRRPHYGVDYAAPYGTPVLAVGDGTITEAQYRGANGNIVKIRHNSTYETAYLHLKGFARGIRRGVTVEQGQVIGYVGNTGRVTGTHLDYRVYKNGRPVNPLTLDLPASESVPDEDMQLFEGLRTEYEQELNQVSSPSRLISGINTDLPVAGRSSSGALHKTHWYEAQ